MNVQTKYNVGDKVYVIQHSYSKDYISSIVSVVITGLHEYVLQPKLVYDKDETDIYCISYVYEYYYKDYKMSGIVKEEDIVATKQEARQLLIDKGIVPSDFFID